VDFLDGGKFFVESCLALIVVLAALRYRHSATKVRRPLRSNDRSRIEIEHQR
jgi:hypothetical protein